MSLPTSLLNTMVLRNSFSAGRGSTKQNRSPANNHNFKLDNFNKNKIYSFEQFSHKVLTSFLSRIFHLLSSWCLSHFPTKHHQHRACHIFQPTLPTSRYDLVSPVLESRCKPVHSILGFFLDIFVFLFFPTLSSNWMCKTATSL